MSWRTVGGGFLALAVAGALGWLLTAAAMVWMARRLGSEDFGLLNLGLAVASCAAAFTAPNLNVWGSRAIARREGLVGDVLVAVKMPQVLLAIAVAMVVSIGAYLVCPEAQAFAIAICSVTIISSATNVQWVAQGLGRLSYVALNQVVTAAICLACVVVLVRSTGDLWGGAAALAAGQAVATTVLLAVLIRKGWLDVRKLRWRRLPHGSAKPGRTFAVTSITAVVIQYGGLLAVSVKSEPEFLGFYSAAARLYLTLVLASALVTTVFYPLLAKHGKGEGGSRILLLWLAAGAVVGGLPGAVLLGAPDYFTSYVLGPGYGRAEGFVQLAAVGVFFNGLSTAFTMAALAAGNDRAFLTSSLVAAGAMLLLGLLGVFVDVRAAVAGLALVDGIYLLAVLPGFLRSFGRTHGEILGVAGGVFLLAAGSFALLSAAQVQPLLALVAGGASYVALASICGFFLWRNYTKASLS